MHLKLKIVLLIIIFKGTSLFSAAIINSDPVSTKDSVRQLNKAIDRNDTKAVHQLLDCNINIDVGDNNGVTALMQASQYGRIDIVQKLIGMCAKINITDNTGRTALLWASRGYDEEPCKKITELLIQAKANVNTQDSRDKKTPLIWAAMCGYVEIAKLLLQSGANINSGAMFDKTALMHVCESKDLNMVLLLLKAGADYDKINELKRRAVDYANESADLDEITKNKSQEILGALKNEGERRIEAIKKFKKIINKEIYLSDCSKILIIDLLKIILDYSNFANIENYDDIPMQYRLEL